MDFRENRNSLNVKSLLIRLFATKPPVFYKSTGGFGLFDKVIQSSEDAKAKLAQFSDLLLVLRSNEIAGAYKLHEESHIIPRENKHQWKGNEIAKCPPESDKHPKKHHR